MSIQSDLKTFYDLEAKKYANTRNKHRSDAQIFLDELRASPKQHIKILEFGCGSGRLLNQLIQLKHIKITYIGVDISQKLLHFAKKQLQNKSSTQHISATFVCNDIVHYLGIASQESFDFVIGIASFQHIPTFQERIFVLNHIYKVLHYEGKLIMTNRSFSRWFLKKYIMPLCCALCKYILSFGHHGWNDLFIPRNNGPKPYKRFYHIYTLKELKRLIENTGFIIKQLCYLGKTGNCVSSRKYAKNTLIIAQKSIFLKKDIN